MNKKFVSIVFLLLSMTMGAQEMTVAERNAAQGFNDTIDRLADDFVTVSLVVADPGGILYASFGHAMLHLQCPVFHLDYIFSYESEGISGNWGRFLRGDLKMGMYALEPNSIYEPYRIDGRGVREYKLNLTPTQKQDLWRIMDELVVIGPNQPYDYYNKGCAISVVHVVKQALHGQTIEYAKWSPKYDGTLRELGYECVTKAQRPWNRFALMTLAGSDIDNSNIPKERKLIVPADLVEVWQQALLQGKPLLESEPHVIIEAGENPRSRWWLSPLAFSILLLLLSFLPFKAADYCIIGILTLMGAIITYTVVFSPLPCTDWNWLIIPFNILPALTWYWRRYWALPYAGVIFIWCLFMAGEWLWGHILVDWAHIVLGLAFCVVLVKQSSLSLFLTSSHQK